MSGWQRARAMLRVSSHLGPDKLIGLTLSGHEALSQPFDIRLSLVSDRADIDPDEVLNQGLTVALQHDGVPVRYFHGIVQSFAAQGKVDGRPLFRYQVRIVPRLWFLGQTGDSRIFWKKSVSDIVRKLLEEAGQPAPVFRLQNPHEQRDYITQYNETDLQFLSRLLQEEGAFYYFEHKDGDHDFVVSDHNGVFKPLPGGAMRFDSAVEADDVLTGWHQAKGTVHGSVRLTDYDPTAPAKRLDATHPTGLKTDGAPKRDIYRWPALTHDPARLRTTARYRVEASDVSAALIEGEGRNRAFVPGATFTVAVDPLDGARGKTVAIQSVSHEAWDHTVLNDGGGVGYTNHFTVFPVAIPWREAFSVPRPRMEGVYAAIVVGPKDTEIHTDPLGRVQVRFFWDHRQDAKADQTIWARVVYPWAGPGWGWQSTPRVDTEVAVAFLDGDPDRPVVLGGMYNGRDKPIYDDKDQKTRSGIRTRSSLKGGASNFNELTFDDKKGNERIYVQAEKDMDTLVKHDQTLTVDHNRMKHVKVDETVKIDNHQSVTIGNGRDTTIKQADDTLTVSMGNLMIEVSMGKIEISAMQSIELKVGSTSVKLDPTGVTMKGMILDFTGTAMLQTSAPLTQLKADGMMILKAGLMMLN